MATTKRRVQVLCYGSHHSIDIYHTDQPEDGYEFQVYLNATAKADTLMTRDQLIRLRDAINDVLDQR